MAEETTLDSDLRSHSAADKSTKEANSLFSYRGPVAGLKGLLTSKIAEGLATVASKIDKVAESVAPEKSEGGTEKIAIERIYPCSDQPRQVFEAEALEELAQTMKELGQAQAITVRKTEKGYEIISGERRYRAAKLIGMTHLDCVVKECTPKEGRLLALVENIQRQDLLPIEEALFLKKVLEENTDLSLVKLAKRLGSHKSTLSEKIQLTEVPEELQSHLYGRGQHFTHRHWRVLSRIADHAFLKTMFLNAIEHRLSVAELERSLSAAGVTKAVRKKKAMQPEAEQLSFDNLNLVQKEGNSLRIKAVTLDLGNLPENAREHLIAELSQLVDALKS